jgi:type III restriction enzyme
VNDIYNKLSLYDEQENSNYAKNFNKQEYKEKVIRALEEIGDTSKTLTEPNYNRILRSYDVLKRQISGTTSIRRIAKDPSVYDTKSIQINTISFTELKKDHAIIFDIASVEKSLEDDQKKMKEAYEELPRKNVFEVENTYFYKCPLNTVILSHANEIDFAKFLIDKRYADKVTAWIKVSDRGFYDIPYSYRKGTHQKEAKFNPDFFIKIGNDIVVIEIKSDDDVNIINKAKMKFAERHFQELNRMNLTQKYYFKFLTPKDYSPFFDSILNETYPEYISDLMAELTSETDNEMSP